MDGQPEAPFSILAHTRPAAEPGALPAAYYPGPSVPVPLPARGGRGATQAFVLAAIVLLVLVLVWRYRRARRVTPARGAAPLARALEARGWTVYYLRGCGYCQKQAALLGQFSKYVEFGPDGAVLGGFTEPTPLAFGAIRGFPHWHNTRTGETRSGYQDAAALAKMAA